MGICHDPWRRKGVLDFAISGDAIQNVSLLIEALDKKDSWPSSLTLNANAISPVLSLREIRELGASVNDTGL